MHVEPFLDEYLNGASAGNALGPAQLAPPGRGLASRRAPAFLARRFHQIVIGVLSEVLEPFALTPQQWGVVTAIVREPGIDQRRLAERRSIDVNSASRLIDELEMLGLVRRVPSPNDRRAYCLELTPAGRELQRALRGPVIEAQDKVLEPLNRVEKETLMELLSRVVEANHGYVRPGNGRRRPARKESRSAGPSVD